MPATSLLYVINDRPIYADDYVSGTGLTEVLTKEGYYYSNHPQSSQKNPGSWVLVGEPTPSAFSYHLVNSCVHPIINSYGKHVVTPKGLPKIDSVLSSLQPFYDCKSCHNDDSDMHLLLIYTAMKSTNFMPVEFSSLLETKLCDCRKDFQKVSDALCQYLHCHVDGDKPRLDELMRIGLIPDYFTFIHEDLRSINFSRLYRKTRNLQKNHSVQGFSAMRSKVSLPMQRKQG